MAKLKNIIKQLSVDDYQAIYVSLVESNADKSAYLLKAMRERELPDSQIMDELDVNTNAYYTLRSRLNQKIEEYLLLQMENPRTDILKKVSNISELVFTKKRAISIATLKKLERELLDYDLSNELTVVYKTLKKLKANSPEHYNYSQLYNRHVGYMLAVDKVEDVLVDYFKKFGGYALSGSAEDKLSLTLLSNQMDSNCSLYESHRLYVYQSCMKIFHRLFVEDDEMNEDAEPIEDILARVNDIFELFKLDAVYYHLRLVFEFLKLEYYSHYKVYRKAEAYYEEVNEDAAVLLSNYNLYTFPAQFLYTKLNRYIRLGTETLLYEENEAVFIDYTSDVDDVPRHLYYVVYRALCCYYKKQYAEAATWLNDLLNEVSLKRYPNAHLEVKTILALQYCMMEDMDLFGQLMNSIQRQIRIMEKDNCEYVYLFLKILKTALSDAKKDKPVKVKAMANKLNDLKPDQIFSPVRYIKVDELFISHICPKE